VETMGTNMKQIIVHDPRDPEAWAFDERLHLRSRKQEARVEKDALLRLLLLSRKIKSTTECLLTAE
jgi:hypothetical protein